MLKKKQVTSDPNISENFIVIVDKEELSADTFNQALQSVLNNCMANKSGVLLSMGDISISGDDFNFEDVKIALPTVTITNNDNTSQKLNGVVVNVGSISLKVPINKTRTLQTKFKIVNDTNKMDTKTYSFQGSTYEGVVRNGQNAHMAYGNGSIKLTLFDIKNLGDGKYEISPESTSTYPLPLFSRLDSDYYSLNTIEDDMVVPFKMVKEYVKQAMSDLYDNKNN
jgi:hypothetical protein